MKNQIITFLLIISYIFCTVTIKKAEKGSCKDSKYTFTLTGTSDEAISKATATVKLSSPLSTTATCTIADATLSNDQGSGGNPSSGGGDTPSSGGGDTPTPGGGNTPTPDDEETPTGSDRRRLAGTAAVTITCTISSALSDATITVSEVKVNDAAATITGMTQITDKVTCPTSNDGGDGNDDDSGKFIQLKSLLFMLFLIVF